jgi:hypothetical protein
MFPVAPDGTLAIAAPVETPGVALSAAPAIIVPLIPPTVTAFSAGWLLAPPARTRMHLSDAAVPKLKLVKVIDDPAELDVADPRNVIVFPAGVVLSNNVLYVPGGFAKQIPENKIQNNNNKVFFIMDCNL